MSGAASGFMALFELAGMAFELQDNQVAEMQNQLNAKENERLARLASADAIIRGGTEAARVRTAATQMIARQRVGFGASGVVGSVGTAAEIGASTRAMSELDALTVENNAAREAWGFKVQGEQIRRQAANDLQRHDGKQWGTAIGGIGRAFGAGAKGM